MNKSNTCFFERMNKVDKLLANPIKWKGILKTTQINAIRNIKKGNHGGLYQNPILNPNAIKTLNNSISGHGIKEVRKNTTKKKASSPNESDIKFNKVLRKDLHEYYSQSSFKITQRR